MWLHGRRNAVSLALIVMLSGCGHVSTTDNALDDTAVSVPSPTTHVGATTTAAMPTAVAELVDRAVAETLASMAVPGAVVLVRTPDFELLRPYGFRDVERHEPMTVDDHFRVGSTTKTMVGTVALQLAAEGLLELADPIADFRPDVPNGTSITIANLLEMRSGLYNYYESYAFNATLDSDPGRAWAPDELVDIGLSGPQTFAPGTDFEYSNTNTVLLATILEQITGRDIGTLLRQRIFEPLTMTDSSFPAPNDSSLPEPFARGYFFGTNVENLTPPVLAPEDVLRARSGEIVPNDETNLNPSWISSAGGAISTAPDLGRYVEEMIGGSLVPEPLRTERLDSVEPVHPRLLGVPLRARSRGIRAAVGTRRCDPRLSDLHGIRSGPETDDRRTLQPS